MKTQTDPSLFQRIVEEMPEAVIVSDRRGVIILWNRGAEEMFGHAAAEALWQSLVSSSRTFSGPALGGIPDGNVDRRHPLRARAPRRAIRKDGQRISIEFSITLRRDADGALVGAAASIRCDGAVGTRARRPDPACASHNRSHPAWSGLSLVDRPIQGGTA